MRRLWIAFVVLLISSFAPAAQAQGGFTTVTGTITGAVDGLVWSCGTISAQLITAGGASPTLNGGGFSTSTAPIGLGCPSNGQPAGSFAMRLADSGVIVPSNTTWQFTVTMSPGIAPPAGTGPQSFTFTTAINCSTNTPSTCTANSMSISAQLSALAPKLSNAGTGGGGFPVTTAVTVNSGGSITPTGTGTISSTGFVLVSVLPATCTPGASNSVQLSAAITVGTLTYGPGTAFYCDSTNHYSPIAQGAGASPIMAFYLSNACPPANNAQCFFTAANTQQAIDVSYTSGSPNIVGNTAHWVAGDIGKRWMGWQTCMASINLSQNSNNGPFTTSAAVTILSVTDGSHIAASANAATTVTFLGTFPKGGCGIWGTPDDAGAVLLDAAMQAAPFCPKLDLAAAYYWFNTFHFVVNPPACAALGVSGGQNAGNIVYSSGFEINGRGAGTTNLYIPPGFPETGTCSNGFSTRGCWVIPLQGKWKDFQLTGGGDRVAPNICSGCNIIESDGPASLADFVGTNFGERAATNLATNGVAAYLWTQLNHVNLSAFGTTQLATNVSSSVTCIQCWFENIGTGGIGVGILPDYFSQTVSQFSKYNFICYDCTVSVESLVDAVTPPFLIVNKGLAIKWYRGGISTVAGTNNTNNMVGYFCNQNGCVLDVEDAFFDLSQPSTGTGYIAVQCANTCTNFFKNTIIKGSSGGSAYTDGVAGSILNDLAGNTIGNTVISGSLIADGHSLQGACTGVGTAASTLGLYGTGANVVATSCSSVLIGTGTVMTGARTLQNMIVTATAAGTNGASGVVTVLKNGGATAITCTIGTTTRCVDGTHTVSVVSGDLISIQFTTQAADTLAGVKALVEWN